MKKLVFLIYLIYCACIAQNKTTKTYSLDDCIKIAIQNNLNLKSTQNTNKTEAINFRQSKNNLLPTLNGSYNAGVNNGRSVDPFTNDFIEQKLYFSSANLSLNATIFNGFRLLNSMRQNKLNAKASELDVEQEKQNLILNVTLAYLQVLNNKAILNLNRQRLEVTKKQLKVQKDLYNQGRDNPADYTDLLGQKSIEETNILSSKITLNNSKLELSRLLNIDSEIDIETKEIFINLDKYKFSSEDIYQQALNGLPTFKANELRVKAAEKRVSVAKSQYIPEISLFGELNTNYSSAAQLFTETGSSIINTGNFVTINNQNIPVLTNQKTFSSETINYFDQLENNLNSVVGVSVRIPFFNSFRAKNNVALQKIRVEETLIQKERTQQEIKNAIKQVHFDMSASYLRYQSLSKQVEAFEKSFKINKVRFNNGVSNFLAYITSKNNLETAKINLYNAKYSYFLRVKILEYYRGNNTL